VSSACDASLSTTISSDIASIGFPLLSDRLPKPDDVSWAIPKDALIAKNIPVKNHAVFT